jgi:hypothetical protein
MPRVDMQITEYSMHPRFFNPGRPSVPVRFPVLLLVAIAATLLIASPVAAHAPTDIVLSYDNAAKQLSVTITHPVPNPDVHYISNVKVKVNDLVTIDNDYKSQPNGDTFTYTYPLPANAGDTIRVTATCITGASLTKTLDLPAPGQVTQGQAAAAPSATAASAAAPAGAVPSPTPKAAPGLLPVIGAAFVLFGLIKKQSD